MNPLVRAREGFEVSEEQLRRLYADSDGNPATGMPASTMRVSIEETATGSQVTSVMTFASLESLEQVLAMGLEEGLEQSTGQMESVLAEG